MAITLTYGATTIAMPANLMWTDEFAWSPIEQATGYSTTGALLVDLAERQAGRPITLDGRETAGWITRDQADTITAWTAIAGAEMVLTLRGVARDVIFDHAKTPFEATPLWPLVDGEQWSGELLVPVLRFLEM